jgi:hypothetical protein
MDPLKLMLLLGGGYYLFKDQINSVLGIGTASPQITPSVPVVPQVPEAPASSPAAAPTVAMLRRAAIDAIAAAQLSDAVRLTADQWNYYAEAETGRQQPELHDPANRAELLTARQYHQRRAAAGLRGARGLAQLGDVTRLAWRR